LIERIAEAVVENWIVTVQHARLFAIARSMTSGGSRGRFLNGIQSRRT
jgi:hypothetical protein